MLRVAMVGFGAMGKNHARIYAELEETVLVGVADCDENLANAVGRRHGTPAYADYRRLLRE